MTNPDAIVAKARADRAAETLRADRAEESLTDRERQLADVLAMADWLEHDFGSNGDGRVSARVVAGAIRRTIRGIRWAP